jgi:general secretion pathway protein J
MAILALITTAVSAALHFGRRSLATSNSMHERGEVAVVQSLLRQLLSQSLSRSPSQGAQFFPSQFTGSKDRIAFVAVGSERTVLGGLYDCVVEVRELPGTGGEIVRDLVLRQVLFRTDPADRDRPQFEHVLLARISGLKARYFGADGGRGSDAWTATWANLRALPALAELVVEFLPGDRRRWSTLVIELQPR